MAFIDSFPPLPSPITSSKLSPVVLMQPEFCLDDDDDDDNPISGFVTSIPERCGVVFPLTFYFNISDKN